MGIIVAIGGGENGRSGYPYETGKIDREIVKLSGKKRPKLLFIPPPSKFEQSYFTVIKKNFSKLVSIVNPLYLSEGHTKTELRKKILGADIIYVGGGNTLQMMKMWRKTGIDKMLIAAYKKGVVLSGLSAGSICWFRSGLSDSRRLNNPKAPLIKIKGLGIINAIHCPHYDDEKGTNKGRKKDFKEIMKKTSGVGIGIDECCALVIEGKNCRLVNSKKGAGAYKVFWSKGKFHHEKITENNQIPIDILISK